MDLSQHASVINLIASSRGIGRGFPEVQETPYKIWTFEFATGTQHTIQFGYSKQLIVMTQYNNLL